MIDTDDYDYIPMRYVIDEDSKRFGPVEDILTDMVPSMKKYGLNVHLSPVYPGRSYMEDEQLIVKLKWKVELTELLWTVNDRKDDIPQNFKGIILYQRMPSGQFVVKGTNILDRETIEKLDNTIFIRHIFPLPNENIAEAIKEQIRILYNSL